jgi:hypothetical protein
MSLRDWSLMRGDRLFTIVGSDAASMTRIVRPQILTLYFKSG